MKKTFLLTILSLFLSSTVCLSQSNKLTTYSVYDVNHDTKVAVSDATAVVDRAKKTLANDQQVVDAAALNAVLKSIEARLAAIEEKLSISTDPYNGHEYVDLGLPSGLKWATMNVGATTPEDYGQYFAWGETTGYGQDTNDGRSFNWASYKWCNGSDDTMTKYCTLSDYGTVDDKTTLDPEDDAAHVNWGGDWRMPTKAEQVELRNTNNCSWTWTTKNGVNGYEVTSKKNGNSIFLPASGYRGSSLGSVGSGGYYWSSSLSTNRSYYAYYLGFYSSNVISNATTRYSGHAVRAVCQ